MAVAFGWEWSPLRWVAGVTLHRWQMHDYNKTVPKWSLYVNVPTLTLAWHFNPSI